MDPGTSSHQLVPWQYQKRQGQEGYLGRNHRDGRLQDRHDARAADQRSERGETGNQDQWRQEEPLTEALIALSGTTGIGEQQRDDRDHKAKGCSDQSQYQPRWRSSCASLLSGKVADDDAEGERHSDPGALVDVHQPNCSNYRKEQQRQAENEKRRRKDQYSEQGGRRSLKSHSGSMGLAGRLVKT
jgi:hypothetical protein